MSSRLLSAMSGFIAGLNTNRSWSEALAALLPRLGADLQLSRAALFEVHSAGTPGLTVTCQIDWARPGLRSLADDSHPPVRPAMADARQREWAERRTRGEVIEGRTRDLDGYLGAFFSAAGIVSFYTVPVMVAGHWWGHFCVSSDDPGRVWSEDERTTFQALAALIALAVERSRAGRALSEASRLAMLAAALDSIITIDEAGQIVDFNPVAEAMFGYAKHAVIGRFLTDTIVPQQHCHAHQSGMARYMAGAEPRLLGRRVETEAVTSEGRVFPIELTVTEIRTDRRRLFTAYLRDISDRVRAKEALERLAYSDPVTNLPNRAGIVRLIHAEGRPPVAALVMRLPDLAILSASLGEEFIHPLVIAVANRLSNFLPQMARLARTGENEFAIILTEPGRTDVLGAHVMLERSVESCARWNAIRQVRGLPPRYVSVNLAASQLSAPDLVPRIAAVLRRHGVPGEWLLLELTESALLSQPEIAANVIQQLKGLGCSVAIDDFGTGYSSFSYLQHLPADVLKIDRSFFLGLSVQSRAGKIVAVMVDLAHALGMSVVAEGVEGPDILEAVETLGCDFMQGYLTGRPMSFEAALLHEDGVRWPRGGGAG